MESTTGHLGLCPSFKLLDRGILLPGQCCHSKGLGAHLAELGLSWSAEMRHVVGYGAVTPVLGIRRFLAYNWLWDLKQVSSLMCSGPQCLF